MFKLNIYKLNKYIDKYVFEFILIFKNHSLSTAWDSSKLEVTLLSSCFLSSFLFVYIMWGDRGRFKIVLSSEYHKKSVQYKCCLALLFQREMAYSWLICLCHVTKASNLHMECRKYLATPIATIWPLSRDWKMYKLIGHPFCQRGVVPSKHLQE